MFFPQEFTQLIEFSAPEFFVCTDPVINFFERLRTQLINPLPAGPAFIHESSLFENSEVFERISAEKGGSS